MLRKRMILKYFEIYLILLFFFNLRIRQKGCFGFYDIHILQGLLRSLLLLCPHRRVCLDDLPSLTLSIFLTKFYIHLITLEFIKKKTLWPEFASELYRPSDRRLSAKLIQTFADRGVSRSYREGSLLPYSWISRPKSLLFISSSSSIVLMRLSGQRSRPTISQKMW
jgi:hypothetical protein